MLKKVKYLSICPVLGKMLFTQNKKERLNLSLFLVMYDCYINACKFFFASTSIIWMNRVLHVIL